MEGFECQGVELRLDPRNHGVSMKDCKIMVRFVF